MVSQYDTWTVDEFFYNDLPQDPERRRPIGPIPIQRDAEIEAQADLFETFTRTLPTRLQRRIAWTAIFDQSPIRASDFEVTPKVVREQTKIVREAYARWTGKSLSVSKQTDVATTNPIQGSIYHGGSSMKKIVKINKQHTNSYRALGLMLGGQTMTLEALASALGVRSTNLRARGAIYLRNMKQLGATFNTTRDGKGIVSMTLSNPDKMLALMPTAAVTPSTVWVAGKPETFSVKQVAPMAVSAVAAV